MRELSICRKGLLLVLLLTLSGSVSLGQAEATEPALSWSLDKGTKSYTNDQTGIHFPLKVSGFKRRSRPKKNGDSVFTYRKGKNVITVKLSTILNFEKRMALEGDLFLENQIETILRIEGGLFEEVERLSLRRNLGDQVNEGLGLMAHVRKLGRRGNNQTYAGYAMFEMEGILFYCRGNFRGKRGVEEFMNFLNELGIEKTVYNSSPKLRYQIGPEYPKELKEAGVKGVVVVGFLVSKEGKVIRVKTIESPDSRLSALAEKRILSSLFSPGVKDGFIADYELQIPVSFGSDNQIVSDEFIATLGMLKSPGDRAPRVSYEIAPRYPKKLKKEGVEGSTIVKIVISKEGYVLNAETIESSHPEFSEAAEEAIMPWVFEPAIKAGTPVACRVQVSIDFSLKRELKYGIVDMEELDRLPVPKHRVYPVHPFALKRAGIDGEVLVQFIVTKEGDVLVEKIIRATHPGFEESAIMAIRLWKFEPGMKDGEPVAVRLRIPFGFTINK